MRRLNWGRTQHMDLCSTYWIATNSGVVRIISLVLSEISPMYFERIQIMQFPCIHLGPPSHWGLEQCLQKNWRLFSFIVPYTVVSKRFRLHAATNLQSCCCNGDLQHNTIWLLWDSLCSFLVNLIVVHMKWGVDLLVPPGTNFSETLSEKLVLTIKAGLTKVYVSMSE